jgi:hypothetical protein
MLDARTVPHFSNLDHRHSLNRGFGKSAEGEQFLINGSAVIESNNAQPYFTILPQGKHSWHYNCVIVVRIFVRKAFFALKAGLHEINRYTLPVGGR